MKVEVDEALIAALAELVTARTVRYVHYIDGETGHQFRVQGASHVRLGDGDQQEAAWAAKINERTN